MRGAGSDDAANASLLGRTVELEQDGARLSLGILGPENAERTGALEPTDQRFSLDPGNDQGTGQRLVRLGFG